MLLAVDDEIRDGTCPDDDPPLGSDGLQGVTRDIEDGLHHLIAVDTDDRQARIVIAHESHTRRRLRHDELGHVLGQLVRTDHLLPPHAARAQHAIDERGETVRLGNDDLGVALQLAARELALEQLRGTAHAAERILDLVRELPNDLLRQALTRHEATFADDLALARMVVQLDQHALTGIERRRAAVEAQVAASSPRLQCPQADRYALGDGPLAELDELVGTLDDLAERMTDRLPVTETEQILRCQIEVRDDELCVERDDRDAETAEYLVCARRFGARATPAR